MPNQNKHNIVIWLIDDDADELYLITKTLLKLNNSIHVQCFENPEEALEKIKDANTIKPTLILSDINMPTMQGPDFFSQLDLLCDSSVEFILCSSALPLHIKESMLHIQHKYHITEKPSYPQDLAALILKMATK